MRGMGGGEGGGGTHTLTFCVCSDWEGWGFMSAARLFGCIEPVEC